MASTRHTTEVRFLGLTRKRNVVVVVQLFGFYTQPRSMVLNLFELAVNLFGKQFGGTLM